MFDFCVFYRTFGLDSDSALNLYITTLLLQEKADNEHCEVGARNSGLARVDEGAEAEREDVLEHVLRIVPQLSSTVDLVISLHTALTKVRLTHSMQVTGCKAQLKILFTWLVWWWWDKVLNTFCGLLQLSPYNYERIERVLKTIQTADESTTVLPLNQVRDFICFTVEFI